MVDGMAKIATGKMQGRLHEVDSMEEVVREITKAEPESRAPWVAEPVVDPYRKLTDDVVDTGLSPIFSHVLDPTHSVCTPGTLPLCTDNVGPHSTFSATFPDLAAPK